jgi:hypothetical protein
MVKWLMNYNKDIGDMMSGVMRGGKKKLGL